MHGLDTLSEESLETEASRDSIQTTRPFVKF